jgi:hypothetical protein
MPASACGGTVLPRSEKVARSVGREPTLRAGQEEETVMVTTPYDQRKGAVPPSRPMVRIRGRYVHVISKWHLQPGRPSNFQIDLDDVDSSVKLLDVIHHLSGQPWFDAASLRALIVAVCRHFRWELPTARRGMSHGRHRP